MTTPSNRATIQIARGTYLNLAASISKFREGELLYAKDQNVIYVIENGSMVSLFDGTGNSYGACITIVEGEP